MLDFLWESWKEYYWDINPDNPLGELPLPHLIKMQHYHQQPWTNDENLKTNGTKPFPTMSKNTMLRARGKNATRLEQEHHQTWDGASHRSLPEVPNGQTLLTHGEGTISAGENQLEDSRSVLEKLV